MPYREAPRVEHHGIACFYCGCLVQAGTCPSCMADMQRSPGPFPSACRRCGKGSLDKNNVGWGCSTCGGLFIMGEEWDRIVEALRMGRSVDHATIVPPPPGSAPKLDLVKTVPCACCGAQMERAPFGARSSINVDICPKHGIWLDSGELVGILEFVRKLWRDNGGHILSLEEQRDVAAVREFHRVVNEQDKKRADELEEIERITRGT